MKRSIHVSALAVGMLAGATAHPNERPALNAYFAASSVLAPPALASSSPRAPSSLRAPGAGPAAIVASTDARRGIPTFLWASAGQPGAAGAPPGPGATPEGAARAHLDAVAPLYGLSPAALQTVVARHVHDPGRGAIVVTLSQEVDKVPLFQTEMNVVMRRNLDLVAIGGNLHACAAALSPAAQAGVKPGSSRDRAFTSSPSAALATALGDLYGVPVKPADLIEPEGEKDGYRRFALAPTWRTSTTSSPAASGLRFARPARVKKVFFPLPDRIVPGYLVELVAGDAAGTRSDAYAYVVAAGDLRLLYRDSLTHAAAFTYRVWADTDGDHTPADAPERDFSPHPTGQPDGSFPPFVAPGLIAMDGFNTNPQGGVDPWLPAGAVETRGNNVDAYGDHRAPDGFSSGDVRADVTSPGVFDRVYQTSREPLADPTQIKAAVTQIFYVTNWLHDWYYDSGFDEAAGDAQADNYGRGGLDGDPLLAEAQDDALGPSRDNADMSALFDGASPRMQVYLSTAPDAQTLVVSPLDMSFATGLATFGRRDYSLTGQVVLAEDGAAPTNDGCQPIVNDVSGKIALLDLGDCSPTDQALAAQDAGAVGVLLANDAIGVQPPFLGYTDASVTIPVQGISRAAGGALKTALLSGPAQATLTRSRTVTRDATLDDLTVAHEWGHYLHLRQVDCGTSMCDAESEGWGDFVMLAMMVREGDDLDGAYSDGSYSTAAFGDRYFGDRRAPYSVDFEKNALTFRHIAEGEPLPTHPLSFSVASTSNAEVHNAGEVWASMMFEAYIALLKPTIAPNPTRTFAEVQRRMADYVVAGLQITPPNPTYTEQRDAILAAALASDEGDFQAMAAAFARRGAGTCAVSPPAESEDFTGVVESFEVSPNVAVVSVTLDDDATSCDDDGYLDAEETGTITVEVQNRGTAPVARATATLATTTPGVTFPAGNLVSFGPVAPFAWATATVAVALDPAVATRDLLRLTIGLGAGASCAPKVADALLRRLNVDETPARAAVDDVEATATVWRVEGEATAGTAVWSRVQATPTDRAWHGADLGVVSDSSLESPDLTVGATGDFVMTFSHRHRFEESDATSWDGAVVEISADGGGSWADIGTAGDPGYNGVIYGDGDNPLGGRSGYVGESPAWPAAAPVSINMGTGLAGKTVRVRFRIGTDGLTGASGWEIDDLGFKGITNLPFPTLGDDKSSCKAVAPGPPEPPEIGPVVDTARGGGDGCGCALVGVGDGPSAPAGRLAPLVAGVAWLLARRRRR